jgi:UDP-N-acetylmuramate--alanine ligase
MSELLNISSVRQAYFIGVGGIGMSALARFFNSRGVKVFGYDRAASVLTATLEAEGITVHLKDDPHLCPEEVDLVVYTPAIAADNKIWTYFTSRSVKMVKRSEALQLITASTFNICCAGTHGKTTTSTMVAHVLRDSGYGCNAFLGGIATNYGTNFWSDERPVAVIEADEFDRSFLRLYPDIISISSMDPDHLDIYGTAEEMENAFLLFASGLRPGGLLILQHGLKKGAALQAENKVTYAVEDARADVHVTNLEILDGAYHYTVKGSDWTLKGVVLNMGGRHNVENSLVAITIAKHLGIEDHKIIAAIASFKGVRRRFEYVLKSNNAVLIDDYAHHPEELRALITSARELYPDMKCTVVFQPHLYSRTRDFASGFAESLDLADRVILLPVYPARELPIEGVSSNMIADLMKTEVLLVNKEDLTDLLKEKQPALLIAAGAGDIDQLVPLIKESMGGALC